MRKWVLCCGVDMVRPAYTGQLPADLSPATQMNTGENSVY